MACFTFGMDGDTPDVFMRTARFAVDAHIDLPRFADRDAISGHAAVPAVGRAGPDPKPRLGAL